MGPCRTSRSPGDERQCLLYVADGVNAKVYILDRQPLEVLTSFGDGGRQPGQFYGVHNLAADSRGNLDTTETDNGARVRRFINKGVVAVTSPDRGPWAQVV